jgi:hypothetical protein
MSEDRLQQIRRGFAGGASQGDEPPDLGPLRALAEREELADAAGRLADAYGRPLWDDDPLRPLAADIARALAKAGFHLASLHPAPSAVPAGRDALRDHPGIDWEAVRSVRAGQIPAELHEPGRSGIGGPRPGPATRSGQ